MNKNVSALVVVLCGLIAVAQPVVGQSQQQMDQLLNAVDRPGAWQKVPVSGSQPQSFQSNGVRPGNGMMNGGGMNNGMMRPGMMNGGGMNNGMMRPGMMNGGMMNGGGMQRQGLFGAPAAKPTAKPVDTNPFSPQNMLKTFLGGPPSGGSSGGGTVDDSSAVGNAQSQCQIAKDQASQAEGDCGRASYGEQSSRKSAAYSAQCHADAARAAADQATSLAAGHSQPANDAAAQARDAANRAQAAADRASYNANTGN